MFVTINLEEFLTLADRCKSKYALLTSYGDAGKIPKNAIVVCSETGACPFDTVGKVLQAGPAVKLSVANGDHPDGNEGEVFVSPYNNVTISLLKC